MAHEPDSKPLLSGLVVSDAPQSGRGRIVQYSLAGHAVVAALLILVPILWPVEHPEPSEPIAVVLYDPPPPPPLALPRGSALVEKQKMKPTTAQTKPDPDKLTTPHEQPKEAELKPEVPSEQVGVADGSDNGSTDGMEGGVDGGQVGGVPGGVLGGVLGGIGTGEGLDQPLRLLRQPKPVYPPEAAVKRIEGKVELEIIIGIDGSVEDARVTKSIPLLDQAAIQNVRQWLFTRPIKDGKPLRVRVFAEVKFRLL